MNNQYRDVSSDLMQAVCGYGADPGTLTWGANSIDLTIDEKTYHGIYLSFALVDNPQSVYHNKHIAIMQCVEIANYAIFVVCEDKYVELRFGAYGTNPVFVTSNGDIFQQYSGFDYYINGIAQDIPLAGGTSQGIAYFDYAIHEIVWMDTVIGHNTPTYGNARFVRAYVIGDWVFGQSADGPNQVLGYHLPTSMNYVVLDSKIDVAPRGNQNGNNVICAISEPGLFVSGENFIPPFVAGEPQDPDVLFKLNVIRKLGDMLNQAEIDYLVNLVKEDIE